MKIAVCDDNPREQQGIVELLYRHRPQWQATCFSSGEDLIEAVGDDKAFDLIFLDIYMHRLSGMETAEALRSMGCHTALVFFTTSRDFAVESYQVEALSYLVKPVEERQFLAVLHRFETSYRPRQIRLGNQLVAVDHILYLESQDKKVVAYLKNGTSTTWTAKLDDVEEGLMGKQFLRCHRSFLINMDAVSRVSGGKFLLSNRMEIPIRRQDVAEITQRYYQYITS